MMRFFGAALLSFTLLFSCTQRQVHDGKTLSFILGDDAKSLDPALCYDTVSNTVMPLAVESLFEYHYLKRPVELQPLLAAAMPEVSKDRRTYTIKIKQGVRWQDDPAFPEGKGRELKAQDFIYAWKRLALPDLQSPGSWIFDDKVVGWNAFKERLINNREKRQEILMEDIEGFKALDDYTIQVRLTQPYPQLLYVLAMGFGAPVAKEVTDKYGQDGLTHRMVGTGPYRLVQYTPGSRVVLEKNPGFRGQTYPSEGDEEAKQLGLLEAAGKELPFADRIEFHIIKESQPGWLQFMRGNMDAAGIPKDNFDAAIANDKLKPELEAKGLKLIKDEMPRAWYLEFNMKDKVVGGKNSDLRKAISMAINREEYIQMFLNGRAVPATSMVPRVIAGHIERPEQVNGYNPQRAKELLAKAGYPGGKGLPAIKFDLRGADSVARQQGEYIQKALGEIGIKIEVVPNTFPAFLKKSAEGNLQFF